MKDFDTMTVTKVGQGTLPKWWRDASGLARGGVVEVRPARDGRHSIVLTPRARDRRGLSGSVLLRQFGRCPHPVIPPVRHVLPFK